MKLLIMLLFLVSCGYEISIRQNVQENTVSFDGYFLLDGPSDVNCIRLTEKAPGLVDLESDCQSFLTVNPQNSSIGQFPSIVISNLVVIEDKIIHTRNLNYTTGGDLEEDVSGGNITGSRRTDIVIEFVDDKLRLTIDVYENANNNNLNEIVASRIFNEI